MHPVAACSRFIRAPCLAPPRASPRRGEPRAPGRAMPPPLPGRPQLAGPAPWNPLNLQLQGLGDVTKNNMDRFKPIVDELVIKYTTGMYMGPEMRLVLHVGALVMTVHAANTGSPALSEALNRAGIPVNPSVADTDL